MNPVGSSGFRNAELVTSTLISTTNPLIPACKPHLVPSSSSKFAITVFGSVRGAPAFAISTNTTSKKKDARTLALLPRHAENSLRGFGVDKTSARSQRMSKYRMVSGEKQHKQTIHVMVQTQVRTMEQLKLRFQIRAARLKVVRNTQLLAKLNLIFFFFFF